MLIFRFLLWNNAINIAISFENIDFSWYSLRNFSKISGCAYSVFGFDSLGGDCEKLYENTDENFVIVFKKIFWGYFGVYLYSVDIT